MGRYHQYTLRAAQNGGSQPLILCGQSTTASNWLASLTSSSSKHPMASGAHRMHSWIGSLIATIPSTDRARRRRIPSLKNEGNVPFSGRLPSKSAIFDANVPSNGTLPSLTNRGGRPVEIGLFYGFDQTDGEALITTFKIINSKAVDIIKNSSIHYIVTIQLPYARPIKTVAKCITGQVS